LNAEVKATGQIQREILLSRLEDKAGLLDYGVHSNGCLCSLWTLSSTRKKVSEDNNVLAERKVLTKEDIKNA
jgi:hypothetical protein